MRSSHSRGGTLQQRVRGTARVDSIRQADTPPHRTTPSAAAPTHERHSFILFSVSFPPSQLSSVLGSVYKGGDVVFTEDGRYLLSPVGNRISFFDLLEHKVHTIDAVTHRDIATMALSPNGHLLLAIDVEGGGCFINLLRRVVLAQFHFKKPVSCAAFSKDSKIVAVSHGRHVQLWRCPALMTQFRPLTLLRTLTGHYDEVRCMSWSDDSKYLLTGSEDMSARLHRIGVEETESVDTKVSMAGEGGEGEAAAASASAAPAVPHLPPITLMGHRGPIVGCYFGQPSAHLSNSPMVYTVSKDGALFVWDFIGEDEVLRVKAQREADREALEAAHGVDEETALKRKKHLFGLAVTHDAKPKRGYSTALFGGRGKFKLVKRHFFLQNHAKVLCCSLHQAKQVDLLVVGFSSGVFGLYELPDFNNIHTLSISQKRISAVSINSSGQWLAFGCEKLGQLLVWEWQSESYILKQQGHFYDINCLSFSPDGQVLATGGDDGKVKLWNTTTGFCFVTFANHTAPITACHWSGVGNVLLTSSMDGTVRAFDLVRYRNFRTMTTPQPAQLVSLAVDPAGEVICGASMEPFEIYVWSLQTGKLLDVLSGHAGPLSCLSFAGAQSLLASSSWDKTVKLWDVFTGKGLVETFTHGTDVLCCAFRADGKELVSSTLDGNLNFWDVSGGTLKGIIEGKRDIMGGRRVTDARSAANATHNTAFTSVCYSSDGKCVLAGGNSRFVCIYDVSSKLLLRRFVISSNLSMDGVLDKLNSKRMSEAGVSMDLIDDEVLDEHDDDPESRIDNSLPGAKRGDFSSRRTRLAVRSKCVRFSPTGGQWAAATTDGLLVYALDTTTIFDPQELEVDVTPANVRRAIKEEDYPSAMRMALSLNEMPLMLLVVESTPLSAISLVVRSLPSHRLERFLAFLASTMAASSHLEYMLRWNQSLMTHHAVVLQQHSQQLMTTFRHMAKTITQQHKDVAGLCNENTFTLEYLAQLGQNLNADDAKVELEEEEEDGADESAEMDVDAAESSEEEDAPRIRVKQEAIAASPRLTASHPNGTKSKSKK